MDERKLVILVNDRAKMSRGKYAAQAVHAALLALGVHPEVPVIVLGGSPAEIAELKTVVHDAGRTEVEPGTLTAGTDWGVESIPEGLCGNREDHEPHRHQSGSLGLFWCHADQSRRLPFAAEKAARERRTEGSENIGSECGTSPSGGAPSASRSAVAASGEGSKGSAGDASGEARTVDLAEVAQLAEAQDSKS